MLCDTESIKRPDMPETPNDFRKMGRRPSDQYLRRYSTEIECGEQPNDCEGGGVQAIAPAELNAEAAAAAVAAVTAAATAAAAVDALQEARNAHDSKFWSCFQLVRNSKCCKLCEEKSNFFRVRVDARKNVRKAHQNLAV